MERTSARTNMGFAAARQRALRLTLSRSPFCEGESFTDCSRQFWISLSAQPFARTPWLEFAIVAVLLGLAAFIGTYLAQKAKNTATKEDIQGITDTVESVKHAYLQRIESLKGSIQLRTVALVERLKAHQEAYALWVRLCQNVHNVEEIHAITIESQNWWASHCLYPTPEARDAFHRAITAASLHHEFLRSGADKGLLETNWAKLENAGPAIVRGAELPDIGEVQFVKHLTP